MKVDLGSGQRPEPGFVGVDIDPHAAIRCDLLRPPWPFADDEITEVRCNHFVEHIPHWRPWFGEEDGWWIFFGELYRVMSPGARARFTYPYLKSVRAFQDPTHVRFIPETSWAYLDREWRTKEKIDHYGADVDFSVDSISGVGQKPGLTLADREAHWDTTLDAEVWLTSRKPDAPEDILDN